MKRHILLFLIFLFCSRLYASPKDTIFYFQGSPATIGNYLICSDDNDFNLHLSETDNSICNDLLENKLTLSHRLKTKYYQFTVANLSEMELYAKVKSLGINSVTLFRKNTDDSYQSVQTIGPKKSKSDRYDCTILPLDLPPGLVEHYILKINYNNPFSENTLTLGSKEELLGNQRNEDVWSGFILGAIVIIFIYNLFQFFNLKENAYIYFAFFAAGNGWIITLLQGLLPTYVPTANYFRDLFTIITSLTAIFGLLFLMSYLSTYRFTYRRHIWLLSFIGLFIVSIILSMIGFETTAFELCNLNIFASLIFVVVLSLSLINDFNGLYKYFLLSGLIGIGAFVYTMLSSTSLVTPYNPVIIMEISMLSIVVMYSFVLAKKVNEYIENEREAQDIALNAAIDNEKLISTQKNLLASKVQERTIDLEQTISTLQQQQEDLKEANEFKDKVFSVISHDLKSPLNTLSGLLEILRISNLKDHEKNKILDNTDQAIQSAKDLLENILAWAHSQHKKEVEDTDNTTIPRLLVEEIRLLFIVQMDNKALNFRNEIPKDLVLTTEKNILMLVLRNLISNAVKFTPQHGEIKIGCEKKGDDIEFFVSDTGVGIHQANLKSLFYVNQIRTTRGTHNEKGSGLGLSLCREFVERINGRIWAESEPGKGSTFRFVLRNTSPRKIDQLKRVM